MGKVNFTTAEINRRLSKIGGAFESVSMSRDDSGVLLSFTDGNGATRTAKIPIAVWNGPDDNDGVAGAMSPYKVRILEESNTRSKQNASEISDLKMRHVNYDAHFRSIDTKINTNTDDIANLKTDVAANADTIALNKANIGDLVNNDARNSREIQNLWSLLRSFTSDLGDLSGSVGAADGIASLDSSGHLPASQAPAEAFCVPLAGIIGATPVPQVPTSLNGEADVYFDRVSKQFIAYPKGSVVSSSMTPNANWPDAWKYGRTNSDSYRVPAEDKLYFIPGGGLYVYHDDGMVEIFSYDEVYSILDNFKTDEVEPMLADLLKNRIRPFFAGKVFNSEDVKAEEILYGTPDDYRTIIHLKDQARHADFDALWKAACGTYGTVDYSHTEDDGSVRPYFLNDLWLTYAEAVEIYRCYSKSSNQTEAYAHSTARTNIPVVTQWSGNYERFAQANIKLNTAVIPFAADSTKLLNAFYSCRRLHTCSITMGDVSDLSGLFFNCVDLRNLSVSGLKSSLSLAQSPDITAASLRFLCENRAGNLPIAVTLHPDVHAKVIAADSDKKTDAWDGLLDLATANNISFVSA